MRLGLLLLIVGFLLCLSISWAAPGFFLMGIGLLCMLIAEERRKALKAPFVDKSNTNSSMPAIDVRAAPISSRNPVNTSFDRNEWETLVGHDPDIARLVDVLTPYGKKYVDQFARMYLARRDKTSLPLIIDKIIETAARHSGRGVSVEPAASGLSSGAGLFSGSAETKQQNPDVSLRAIYEILQDGEPPDANLTGSAVNPRSAPVSNATSDGVPNDRSADGESSPAVSAETESQLDPGLSHLLGRLEPRASRRGHK